jgi:MFS family permease
MTTASGVRELARGWRVVLAGLLGIGLGSTGLPYYAIGQFIRPLNLAFGWTRAEISVVSLSQAGGSLIFAPVMGYLVDRYGAKRLAPVSLALGGVGYALMCLMGHHLLELYLGWFAVCVLSSGSTGVVWARALNAWFDRVRGLALGVALTGSGLVALLAPLVLAPVIAAHGWRAGFLVCGAATGLSALPVWWLLRSQDIKVERPPAQAETVGLTVRQAIKTRVFWQAVAGFILAGGTVTATILHLTPLLLDRGYSPLQVGAMTGMMGITVIIGRLSLGVLVDRIHAPYVGVAFFGAAAAADLCLIHGWPLAGIALIGLAAGAEIDLLPYLSSRYFGLKAYGAIYGWQLALFSLGASFGPVLMGAVHDHFGDYRPGLYGCVGLIAAGVVLIGTLGRYPPALQARGAA